MGSEASVLESAEGTIKIFELPGSRYRIETDPAGGCSVELAHCETAFPLEVIEYAIERFPFASLCAWLARHEDAEFISVIHHQLFGYCKAEEFAGKRLLDFGCGSGASTFAMASILPSTEIVGVDLNAGEIDVAQRIAEIRKVPNVRFLLSPAGDRLPPGTGKFDYVTLNAVYEHLLPEERRIIMPLLWSIMKPASVLFINQTPYRYFPYEHHSTKLWFINYLPDRLAHWIARRFARLNPAVNRSSDWGVLLRGGIRGATEGEIIRNLIRRGGGEAKILQPSGKDIFDRASFWLSETNPTRHRRLKRMIAWAFRCSDKLFGTIPSTTVDLAVRKEGS